MPRLRPKTVKLIVLEVIQWCAFASVVFVTAQKLVPRTYREYTLIIALSVGYVAGATLLIWIPIKLTFLWMRCSTLFDGKWCPSMLVYVVLGSLPCCIMSTVGIETSPNVGFQSVCAELMVIMLVVVDITEKMKTYSLRSREENSEDAMENGEDPQSFQASRRQLYNISSHTSFAQNRPKRFPWNDSRPTELLESMLNAYDIRLILGLLVKNEVILCSNWNKAIYIIAWFGMLTFIPKERLQYKFPSTVILLDVPFFFLRLSIICVFGDVTNALFLFKNVLAFSFFIYFCVLRPIVFKSETSSNVIVNSVDFTPNGNAQVVGDISYHHQEHSNDIYYRSRENSFQDDSDDPNEDEAHDHGGSYYNHQDQTQTDEYNYRYQSYPANGATDQNYIEHLQAHYGYATDPHSNGEANMENVEQAQIAADNYPAHGSIIRTNASSTEHSHALHQNEYNVDDVAIELSETTATKLTTPRRRAPLPPVTNVHKPPIDEHNLPLPEPHSSYPFPLPSPPEELPSFLGAENDNDSGQYLTLNNESGSDTASAIISKL